MFWPAFSANLHFRLHLKLNTRRCKWFKNYALSSPVGFWENIAPAIKWAITIWSIFSKEVLINWQKPKSVISISKRSLAP